MPFAAATLARLVVPGPSVVYVVAAAAGLTALVSSSPWAFAVLRGDAGAAYLIGMGIRQLRRRHDTVVVAAGTSSSKPRLFRDGVLVDLLNPKTGLFFLALLPQVVDASRLAASTQIVVLGLCLVSWRSSPTGPMHCSSAAYGVG